MSGYSGKIYRGVDYSPTWPGWVQGGGSTQTNDSDFANDAFASLWGKGYQAAPAGSPSVPINNGSNYRDDLKTIANDGFNLVRLYNWDMARGTTSSSNTGLDHINFLNYANTLGLKIVVPVSDFFLNDTEFSWNHRTPTPDYAFGSAPDAIQKDFKQFIASITDPTTGKIHSAVHSISVGNEGDIGQVSPTTASNFLARTNWWIYNLNKQINGASGTGPDGDPVINNPTTILLSATFANADQGGGSANPGSWFKDLINGVSAGTQTPNGWPGGGTFGADVKGLSAVDQDYAKYYYNSFNVSQVGGPPSFSASQLAQTLAAYDSGASPWPGAKLDVPLLLMEVFTADRSSYNPTTDQAVAAVNQVKEIEAYLAANQGTTNLMGYNFFEFNDEPALGKFFGLYQYDSSQNAPTAHTGTTSVFYGGFGDMTFPVSTLKATPGPGGQGTLVHAWTHNFAATHLGTAAHDMLVGSAAADKLHGSAGHDSIDGGPGHDTAHYVQNAKAYALAVVTGSSTVTVQDKVGTEGTDILTNVENVRFADQALQTAPLIAAASLPATEMLKVVGLYTAGLDRAPDSLGLIYWASRLADGASIDDIAKGFFSSAEAAPIYSAATATPVFVDLVYKSALGRAPDAEGAAYWSNELDSGRSQRTDFVTALIGGARGPGGSAADAQHVANEEAVGARFALTQGLNNGSWASIVQSRVNATAGSVTAANAQTDAFAATAATAAGSELVVQIVGLVP